MNSNAKEEMNPIKEKYKATIIIPAYNAETTIHRAVDSAVNQTTKEPYEILLMDDGSTDSTSHILDDYAKLHKNIRTIHQKNQGITRTRENAAAAALGTYIFWIDVDDYADEKLLEKALPHWKREMMLSYTVSIHLGRMGVSKKKNQSSEQNYS